MKPANNLQTGMMASTNVETYKLATYNTCNSTFFSVQSNSNGQHYDTTWR